MVRDALRGYLALAGGLSEVTAARARAAARALVEQGEATAGQVTALAEDLVSTSRRNRESLMLVIRHEAEQAVRLLGLGAAADVEALTQRLRRLEQTVRELRADQSVPAGSDGAANKTTAKKTAPRKSAAKKSAAKKTTAKKTAARKSPTKTSAAKTTPRSSSANKSSAKKTTAKKTSAKKSSTTGRRRSTT